MKTREIKIRIEQANAAKQKGNLDLYHRIYCQLYEYCQFKTGHYSEIVRNIYKGFAAEVKQKYKPKKIVKKKMERKFAAEEGEQNAVENVQEVVENAENTENAEENSQDAVEHVQEMEDSEQENVQLDAQQTEDAQQLRDEQHSRITQATQCIPIPPLQVTEFKAQQDAKENDDSETAYAKAVARHGEDFVRGAQTAMVTTILSQLGCNLFMPMIGGATSSKRIDGLAKGFRGIVAHTGVNPIDVFSVIKTQNRDQIISCFKFVDINTSIGEGIYPIHYLSYFTKFEEFKPMLLLMLELGAKIESADKEKRTLLHLFVLGSDKLDKPELFYNELFSKGAIVNGLILYIAMQAFIAGKLSKNVMEIIAKQTIKYDHPGYDEKQLADEVPKVFDFIERHRYRTQLFSDVKKILDSATSNSDQLITKAKEMLTEYQNIQDERAQAEAEAEADEIVTTQSTLEFGLTGFRQHQSQAQNALQTPRQDSAQSSAQQSAQLSAQKPIQNPLQSSTQRLDDQAISRGWVKLGCGEGKRTKKAT